MSLAHVFLIGGMKCGTWTLFKQLRKHRQIAPSNPKELKFFSRTARDAWSKYHENFDVSRSTKVLLDGTTQYSKHPDVPDIAYKISLYDPGAKFIYLMRDPVKRIESQLAHRVARQEIKPDAAARARELRRALNYSKYFTQMGIYATIFGAEQIYARTFESFIADQVQTVRECFDFLGVRQPKDVEPLPPQNVRKSDHGADKVELTDEEKDMIRERLYWEVRSLETGFGVRTAEWREFWGI